MFLRILKKKYVIYILAHHKILKIFFKRNKLLSVKKISKKYFSNIIRNIKNNRRNKLNVELH